MFLGRVIGKIWATRKDVSLKGFRLLVVEPIDHEHKKAGEAFVAIDVVNASDGETIYWVGSREAPNALPDKYGPVDAAVVGIVDQVDA